MRPALLAISLLPASVAAEPAPLRLGIGGIVHSLDGTTESFAALEALRERGVHAAQRPVRVALVDHPAEADYTVSGVIEGDIAWRHDDPQPTITAGWATALGGLVAGAGLAGGAAALSDDGDRSTDTTQRLLVGGAALGGIAVAVGTGLLAYGATHEANRYTWRHSARLTLFKGAEPLGPIELDVRGETRTFEPLPRLRARTLAPLWAALADELARRLDAAEAEAAPPPVDEDAPVDDDAP